MKELYDIREFSEEIGVHWNTSYKYIKMGLVKSITIGRSIRIPKEEVERIKKEGINLNGKAQRDGA